ncbi:methyltransferase [Leucobacter sp. HNU]|uniref:methyltransferase n=1 Tax=Leucobacter sp. HNU TaxID=3236805 RepID=UPI003A7FAE5A
MHLEPELIDRLASDLAAADYRVPAVRERLGAAADDARQRGVFAAAIAVLDAAEAEAGTDPLGTLIRLLLLGEPLRPERIDAALPELGAAGARALGLLAPNGDALAIALSLSPVLANDAIGDEPQHWWILSDLDDQLRRGPARNDHVMGVGGATRSLISQAPAQQVERSLDLGTGCGIVALHLALRGPVVATDISERALALARANARLNGLADRIEFRRGDLFAPVAGDRFDLVLSNPPFVITPREPGAPVYEYRDGGRTGDELAADVVRAAPEHLRTGGTALCLANWESPWGENGLERVRGWIEDASERLGDDSLAAWVIERDRVLPVQYAETWARDGGARPGDPAFDTLVASWLRDFAARRVVSIGLGAIRVRRLAASEAIGGAPRIHLEQATGAFAAEHLGSLLESAFDSGIAAERKSDADALGARWILDRAVVEEREHVPGQEAPSAIVLRTDRPIARRVSADTLLAAAVGACDGELTLGQIADALATLLEVDAAAAREALVAGARELAWFGMLQPID